MRNIVPALYRSYGTYANKSKMLPNITDGLLPVQKRVLLGGHIICRKEFKKTAAVLGGIMAKWHPHTEALGTAEWAIQNCFMEGEGSWGSKLGAEPFHCAAMRYTSLKASDFIENMAFRFINHIPWKEDELEPEPVTIPTMIPFCLMTKYETNMIAFGFKTDIPCFPLKGLIKRILWLITGEGGEPIIRPLINGCKMISGRDEISRLLTTGQATLEIRGTFIEERSNNLIAITSWSPRITFKTIMDRINNYKGWKLLDNGDIGYRDESNRINGTRCIFTVVKQRNVGRIYDQMKKAIAGVLISKINYHIYAVDSEDNFIVKETNVDEMLLRSYAYHKQAFINYLEDTMDKIRIQIDEFLVISKIRPWVSIEMKKSNDVNTICDFLSERTKIPCDNIKEVIAKFSIRKLMSVNIDITDLKNKVKELTIKLKKIDSVCIEEYKNLL